MAKLRVHDLTKRFVTTAGAEITALQDVTLEVQDAELLCVLGPSGCGKSTLLRLVAGLEVPTAGEIWLDGSVVEGPGPDRGMVFQEHLLFPWRTVLQNVEYGLEIQGLPRRERREAAMDQLRLVGLEAFADCYPKELSGGMKQRAGLARALANDPAVLLMDEPFASVDAQTRSTLQAELLAIWWGTRKTILFVTHSVEEAVYLADRVVILGTQPGRVLREVQVDLPRPRYRVSPEFNAIRRDILESIRYVSSE